MPAILIVIVLAGSPVLAGKKKKDDPVKTQKVEEVQQPEEKTEAPADQNPSGQEVSDEGKKPLYTYEKPEESDTGYGWLMFQALFFFGLMGGGFYLFFKFIVKKSGMSPVGQGAVRVLSITPVGQNRSLYIVDVGGRLLLLGVTDSAISMLSEITARDEIDRIKLSAGKDPVMKEANFQEFLLKHIHSLKDAVKGRKTKSPGEHEDDEPSGFKSQTQSSKLEYIMKQKERLKRLSGEDDE